MLILILIDVQYSQDAVFSFEKGSNRQNRSSSCFRHLAKKSPLVPPHPLPLFGKPCVRDTNVVQDNLSSNFFGEQIEFITKICVCYLGNINCILVSQFLHLVA